MPEDTPKQELTESTWKKMTVQGAARIGRSAAPRAAISDMKKEELIAFIREAKGIKDEKPSQKKKAGGEDQADEARTQGQDPGAQGPAGRGREAREGMKDALLRHRISRPQKAGPPRRPRDLTRDNDRSPRCRPGGQAPHSAVEAVWPSSLELNSLHPHPGKPCS